MGNSFKEHIYDKMQHSLLSVDRYGRVCSWNGYPLQILEVPAGDVQDDYAQGVNIERKAIICRDIDINPVPVATEQVNLDGDIWYVESVEFNFAYVKITFGRRVV